MNLPLTVGRHRLNGKMLSYKFTPCDEAGWIDSTKFMPARYDLIFIKVENRKPLSGWWNGLHWDGVNVNIPDGKPIFWKRNHIEVLDR